MDGRMELARLDFSTAMLDRNLTEVPSYSSGVARRTVQARGWGDE